MTRDISRRSFIINGALVLGAAATTNIDGIGEALAAENPDRVYFIDEISIGVLLKTYAVNRNITGKTGIKLHTGEPVGPNILHRDMVRALQRQIPGSSLVQSNTCYADSRATTAVN